MTRGTHWWYVPQKTRFETNYENNKISILRTIQSNITIFLFLALFEKEHRLLIQGYYVQIPCVKVIVV